MEIIGLQRGQASEAMLDRLRQDTASTQRPSIHARTAIPVHVALVLTHRPVGE